MLSEISIYVRSRAHHNAKMKPNLGIWIVALLLSLPATFEKASADLTTGCSNVFDFKVLSNSRDRFLTQFSRSGFKDLADLQNSLKKAPASSRPFVDLIASEQFEVVIRRPLAARESYAKKNGLSNFHETRVSQGDMGKAGDETVQDAIDRRNLIEASYLGVDPGTYRSYPASTKPKYGYLRVPPEYPGGKDHIRASIYGEDAWVLKNDQVRMRTTFILGDSLDRVLYAVPKAYLGNRRFQSFTPSRWDEGLIPWSHREILIAETFSPMSESGILGIWQKMSDSGLKETMKESGFESLMPYTRTTVFEEEGVLQWNNGARYVESQTFGAIAPSDIKAFEFTTDPPKGEFLAFLERHKIEIRDARSWPPKRWNKSGAERNLMPSLGDLEKWVGKKVRATTKDGTVTVGVLKEIYNIKQGGVLALAQPMDSSGDLVFAVQFSECRTVEVID